MRYDTATRPTDMETPANRPGYGLRSALHHSAPGALPLVRVIDRQSLSNEYVTEALRLSVDEP
jgi:hypothetical protein